MGISKYTLISTVMGIKAYIATEEESNNILEVIQTMRKLYDPLKIEAQKRLFIIEDNKEKYIFTQETINQLLKD